MTRQIPSSFSPDPVTLSNAISDADARAALSNGHGLGTRDLAFLARRRKSARDRRREQREQQRTVEAYNSGAGSAGD